MANDDLVWFLTAPSERIFIRRGDPLGFRWAADRYADILVPGLSSRTYDARWLTILSWVLVQANEAWRRYDRCAGSPQSHEHAMRLYGWIRPLELMWVARALALESREVLQGKLRQLPNRRAVEGWLQNPSRPRFGLTESQFRRYRALGPYGAYRTVFRHIPGLTVAGDGWTPDVLAHELAALVDGPLSIDEGAPTSRGKPPTPERYWPRAWTRWRTPGAGALTPEPLQPLRPIGATEGRLIRSVLFEGENAQAKIRRRVAKLCAGGPGQHLALCKQVVAGTAGMLPPEAASWVRHLPSYSAFADAAIEAVRAVWSIVGNEDNPPRLGLAAVAKSDLVVDALEELVKPADAWARHACFSPEFAPALALAKGLGRRAGSTERLKSLIRHHLTYGGGRRWFSLDGSDVIREAPPASAPAAYYRFRLWTVARLAHQCRLTSGLPAILRADRESETDEGEDDAT